MPSVTDVSVTDLLAIVECLIDPVDASALVRELEATLDVLVARHESERSR